MKNCLLLLATLLFCSLSFAQDIVGKWKTIDDETNTVKSHITIYKNSNGKYYAKILLLFNPSTPDPICDDCDDDRKDQKVIGMEFVRDMEWEEDDNEYDEGTILDPKNGRIYGCKMWFEDDNNTLKVRGYWGFFFRTQTWYRMDS